MPKFTIGYSKKQACPPLYGFSLAGDKNIHRTKESGFKIIKQNS